jgi:hypothetical protein
MKKTAFSKLLSLMQLAINNYVADLSLHKCSMLYSLAFGKAYGLHVEDIRDTDEVERVCELLRIIWAFQDNTKLNIVNHNGEQQTNAIPCR